MSDDAVDAVRILSQGSATLAEGLRRASACVDPEESITVFLAELAQGMGARRAALYERGGDGLYVCSYAWRAFGLEALSADRRSIPLTTVTHEWLEAIGQGRPVAVETLGPDAVRDQALLAVLDATDIQRFAAYPLQGATGTVGVLVLYDLPAGHAGILAPVLASAASSFAMLVYRRDGMEAVAQPDQTDRVTGLPAVGPFTRDVNALIAAARAPQKGQGEQEGRGECGSDQAGHDEQGEYGLTAQGTDGHDGKDGHVPAVAAMVYVDIVDFKSYNAAHGFAAGDELLRRMAQTICDVIGSSRVCRYDADRFYFIVPEDGAKDAVHTVHDTAEHDPALGVEVRAGIYRITGAERDAKQAMDRAKMAGDSAYGDYQHYWRRFDPEMERRLTMRGYVISHIDQAIAQGWVKVYYQPIVGTLSGKVESMEALARWDDPTYGLLPPASFIDTLEQGRLVYRLDLEVLRQACEMIAQRNAHGEPWVPVSVNISRSDLEVEDIHERIDTVLESYAVPHTAIHIEITETALAKSEDLVRDHVDRFHEDGYEVWLDDFGSGYSSLNALQHFDFDCAKIDMAFLHNARQDGRLKQFMGDMVAIAKHRGLKTLSEGVETPEQYAMLQEIGCMKAQGYLLSEPRPIDELMQVLDARGLRLASTNERLVYDRLGMVDVATGTYPFPESPSETDLRSPVALVVNRNDNLGLVYANDACLGLLREMGISSAAEAQERANGDNATSVVIRSCMRQAATPGSVACAHIALGGWSGRLCYQLVVHRGDLRAYLVTADVQEAVGDDRLADDLRGLCSLCDEIAFLSPHDDRVRLMRGVSHLLPHDLEEEGLAVTEDWMARELVYPSQAGRLAEMLDPATLPDRIAQAPGGILGDFFDIRIAGDAYELRRIVVAPVPSSASRPEYLLCVARDRAGWTQALLERVGAAGNDDSDLAPSEKNLWDAAVSGDTIGIFWKDADRRFLGANRMFLNYYGLELKDILGKTDEDMGWHPDPEPFRRDELRVLQRGDTVRDAPGICLVHGRPRDIVANKVPVYQDGRIVGLFGYFMDVTDVRARLDAVYRRTAASLRGEGLVDEVTGLANASGIREGCRRFEAAYEATGSDFGYVCVQILGMHRFEADYGTPACEDLHRAIAQQLGSVAGEADLVGRVYDGRYIIVASPCDTARLTQLEETIPEALSAIREVGDTTCTVYCMVGAALYSASNDYGLMTATAEAGMMAGLAQSGERSYTRAGVARALRDSAPAWDLVRLVDPVTMKATLLCDDGNFRRLPGSCAELLGKTHRCDNCASLRALETGMPQRKVEALGDRRYYIVAQPVVVDGRHLVIERMAEIKGEIREALQ